MSKKVLILPANEARDIGFFATLADALDCLQNYSDGKYTVLELCDVYSVRHEPVVEKADMKGITL